MKRSKGSAASIVGGWSPGGWSLKEKCGGEAIIEGDRREIA